MYDCLFCSWLCWWYTPPLSHASTCFFLQVLKLTDASYIQQSQAIKRLYGYSNLTRQQGNSAFCKDDITVCFVYANLHWSYLSFHWCFTFSFNLKYSSVLAAKTSANKYLSSLNLFPRFNVFMMALLGIFSTFNCMVLNFPDSKHWHFFRTFSPFLFALINFLFYHNFNLIIKYEFTSKSLAILITSFVFSYGPRFQIVRSLTNRSRESSINLVVNHPRSFR